MVASAGDGSRLLSIPLEILLQITRHLTTPEYGNLRLTCKHLEASVFNAFSREFFMKKQFMLTHFSLQALVDISNSRLAGGFKHVIMGIERPLQRALSITRPVSIVSPPPIDLDAKIRMNRLREEYIDHIALLEGGHDIEMMAQAFSNLKNLETIEIRDFCSDSRYRDGPYAAWKSYGTTTYQEATGETVQISGSHGTTHLDDKSRFSKRLFQNMLRALGKTDTRPRRFEVNLRYCGLEDNAFKIQKYDERIILPVLENLETLYLDLRTGDIPVLVTSQDHSNIAVPCPSYHLQRFLARIDKIQHLRLNFQQFRERSGNEVISWLAKPLAATSSDRASEPSGPFPCPPPPVLLKNLRRLDIGKAVLERDSFLAVLQKHRATLRGIELHRVALRDASEPNVRVSVWAKFFGCMGKLGLSINHMSFLYLGQEKDGRNTDKRRIFFKDCPKGRRTWEGQDLNGALKDLVDSVVVDWPDEDTESSLLETEDSEDDSVIIDHPMGEVDDDDDGETSDSDDNPLFNNGSLLALSQQLPIYSILGPH